MIAKRTGGSAAELDISTPNVSGRSINPDLHVEGKNPKRLGSLLVLASLAPSISCSATFSLVLVLFDH